MVLFCTDEPSPGLGTCNFIRDHERKGVRPRELPFGREDRRYTSRDSNPRLITENAAPKGAACCGEGVGSGRQGFSTESPVPGLPALGLAGHF